MIENTQVVTNTTIITALVREEVLRGRRFLVAPAVLVREMVLNGEFLPFDAIQNSAPEWEGRQVTLDHPMHDGHFVSAGKLSVADMVVGELHDTHVDTSRRSLKADLWIDIELAQRSEGGQAVLDRFKNNERIEISTGYTAAVTPKIGRFNRTPFVATQSDIRPNHLALLPFDIGACSLKDGCGAPRTNVGRVGREDDAGGTAGDRGRATRSTRHSHTEARMNEDRGRLAAAMGTLLSFFMGGDTANTDADGDGDGDGIKGQLEMFSSGDAPSPVVININGGEAAPDKPCDGQRNREQGETGMSEQERADLITLLVNAESVEASEDDLKDTPDGVLQMLAANVQPDGDGDAGTGDADADGDGDGDGDAQPTAVGRRLEDLVNRLEGVDFDAIGELVADRDARVANEAEEATQIRERLVANRACQITDEKLQSFDLETLRGLEKSFAPATFIGLNAPRNNVDGESTKPKKRFVSNGVIFVPEKKEAE